MPACSTERDRAAKPSRPAHSDDIVWPGDFAQLRYGTKNVAVTDWKVTWRLLTAYPDQFSEPTELISAPPGAALGVAAGPCKRTGKSGYPPPVASSLATACVATAD